MKSHIFNQILSNVLAVCGLPLEGILMKDCPTIKKKSKTNLSAWREQGWFDSDSFAILKQCGV